MSQQNNQNDQNNQIDPNFLPKDSNVYVRTMNSDLNNLKEQGGEALPYAKEPADIPKVTVNTHSTENIPADIPAATIKPSADEYNFADTENQPMSSQEQPMLTPENVPSGTPNIPLENQMPAQPVKENPEPVPDFSSINLTDPQNQPQEGFADQSPDQFETPDKVADSFNKPPEPFASPTQGFPAPMPEAQPSYPSPNEPTPANDSSFLDKSPIAEKTLGSIDFNQPVPEQKDNLSSDLNNLIAPEEFSPISNIDPNGSKNEPKNKLMLPLTILGILALLVVAYLLVWPRFFTPQVKVDTLESNNLLVTPTTVTTTKPNPFLLLRQGFLQSNLNIDISKSPEILKQITDEAKTLGAPQTFKVIAPIIKGQILSSAEILNAFINNTPAELKNGLGEKYILYAYYGEFKPSLGLVFTLKENQTDAVKRSFLNWEVNRDIIKNTLSLWLFSPQASRATIFKDAEILGANVRYFEYPENEVDFSYAFYENYLILSTSLESINTALIYLQNGDTPVIR